MSDIQHLESERKNLKSLLEEYRCKYNENPTHYNAVVIDNVKSKLMRITRYCSLSENAMAVYCIKRPAEGITLNAGVYDYLLDENDEILLFKSRADADYYLLDKGLTDEEISDMGIIITEYNQQST